MATDAGGVSDLVVSARVALAALQCRMRSGQRPTCSGVIEDRRRPVRCAMADFALLGESCRTVIWISRALKILEMT